MTKKLILTTKKFVNFKLTTSYLTLLMSLKIQCVTVDKWWSSVSMTGRYPSLCKLALSILTCFHGPQVESSFNAMNDIIDERSGRTDIETYGAIQSVKYAMWALEKSASKIFVRKDKLHDPVGRSLCNNFRLASRWYRENVAEKNCNLQSRKRKLGTGKNVLH